MDVSLSSKAWRTNTAFGVAEGGVEDLNGAYRARTGDLLLAKQLLSQLS